MELILVDAIYEKTTQHKRRRLRSGQDHICKNYFFNELVNRPHSWSGSLNCRRNSDVGVKLLSEITGGEIFAVYLEFLCSTKSSLEMITFGHDCGCGSINILKCLYERFKENVFISLDMKAMPDYGDVEEREEDDKNHVVSSKGMVIGSDYACNASTKYMSLFDEDEIVENLFFHVTITANIVGEENLFKFMQMHPPNKSYKRILEEGLASDVVITGASGVEMKGHKCILIACSSVIATALEENPSGPVDMSDMSKEGLEAFLRFIYHGDRIKADENNNDVTYELLCAARNYNVPDLDSFMKSHLIGGKSEDFDVKLAFKIYKFVKGNESASDLKAKVVHVLKLKYDELKELPEYKNFFEGSIADGMELCESFAKACLKKSGSFTEKYSVSKMAESSGSEDEADVTEDDGDGDTDGDSDVSR